MFIENLDELPENLRGDFVESEFEGKKGFQHKSTIAMLNAMKHAKDEKATYKSQLDEMNERLSAFEQAKADEIEAARAEALEKAKAAGDTSVLEQQMADLEKRKNDELEALKAQMEEMQNGIKTEKKNAFLSEFVSEMSVKGGEKALKMLLSNMVDVDPATGKRIYLDENGSATSLDDNGFKAEIEKNPVFAPLLKSRIVTQGGGNVNGSGSGASMNRKFNEYSSSELVALKKQEPATYDRLKNEFYGKQ